jgi:ribose 5-phosphate isomerase A
MQHNIPQDTWKHLAGEAAAQLIEDGMVIGIGSGSTSAQFIYALARRIQAGLKIVGAVPTSLATEQLANSLNIPLTDLDTYPELDLSIDGADEIDPQLNLIKGGGGALLREKIVASCSRRFVVIADVTKLVSELNHHTPLPIEVVPIAVTPVRRHIEALGASVQERQLGPNVYHTDNGNVILDCTFADGIPDPVEMQQRLRSIVGVVETGLFLYMAQQAIIGGPDGVKILP